MSDSAVDLVLRLRHALRDVLENESCSDPDCCAAAIANTAARARARRVLAQTNVLANAKHEAFCQYVADGRSLIESYRMAGYRGTSGSAYSAASRLNARPAIAVRIEELMDARNDD